MTEPVAIEGTTDAPSIDNTAIDDMLKSAGLVTEPAPPAEPAPAATPPAPAEPAVEPAPAEPEPSPATPPAPEVTPPVTPPAEDELQRTVRERNELRELLNEMARTHGAGQPVQTPGSAPAVSVPQPPSAPATPPIQEDVLLRVLGPDAIKDFNDKMSKEDTFLTQEELDKLIDDPKLLIPAMNKVKRETARQVVEIIPTIVASMVSAQMATMRAAQDFYEANDDLAPYRDFVAVVYKSVAEAHKDKSQADLLGLTAAEARKRLRLPEKVVAPVSTGPAPALTKTKASGGRQPTTSKPPKSQADYMAELL